MHLEVKGITYVSASDVRRELGIARQTLWRWRQQRKIPAGFRYRNGQVFFSAREVEQIRQFAHHLEALDPKRDEDGHTGADCSRPRQG